MPAPTKKPANNENQVHIFLDLDGVMADFDLHAVQQGKKTADGKMKWNEVDFNWWVTMPVCEGAKEFYNAAKKKGVVKFLTAPPLSTDSFSGKAAWVEKFVPERGKFVLKDLIICPSSDKHYLAKPNHILVDDRIKNVEEWVAAGGIGIHHKGDFKETLKKLELVVKKLATANSAPQKINPVSQKFNCAWGM